MSKRPLFQNRSLAHAVIKDNNYKVLYMLKQAFVSVFTIYFKIKSSFQEKIKTICTYKYRLFERSL